MKSATGKTPPKILCLTSHDINGPDYGAVLRARNVFRLLARLGEVRVILADAYGMKARNAGSLPGGFEVVDVMRLHPVRKQSITGFLRYEFDGRFLNTHKLQASARDQERLQALMAGHDLVWIHGLTVANGFGLFRWPHSVLDIDDVPSCFHRTEMAQATNLFEKFRRYRRMLRWRQREKKLLERFDALCVCSEPDRRELGGSGRIFVVPNGFNAPDHMPARQPAVPPRIGFVGNLQYPPNSDGLRWFIERVWPRILQTQPQARLRLAGLGSEKQAGPGRPNADGLGWIADVAGEMATWSLAIVPLFVGGGTRIKIAEAFSRKCPVVSTALGAYGYDVVNGREIWIADSPEDFAAKCLEVLTNPSAARAMAETGWQRFLENWTWDSYAGRVANVVEAVLQ